MEKEKDNFFRFICLMTEVVVEVLRCRLKQSYINSKLQTLPSFLQEIDVLHTIFHLFFPEYLCCWRGCRSELAKGFSKEQWAILYDADSSRCCKQNRKDMDKLCICCVTPKQVDESKLDLSLLSLILINCCKLMPHEKEAVRKIREMKNLYISHSSKCSLSNSDFKSLWHEAEYLIKQLNSTHVYLNKQLNLLHRPMDEALMQKYFVHCLESTKIEHLESEMKVVHASIIEGNENVMEAIQELKSSFEHHQRESMHILEVKASKRKQPESTKFLELSSEDTEDDCIPRKRKLQKLMEGFNLNKGNTDPWTYKLPDTKPLDQFREYISSNHLGSNVSTSVSLQMNFTIFTMKDVSKQKDFKDTDKFICGKCNWLFVSLDEFLKHKEECKIIQKENEIIKAEYKKYVVVRLTVPTTNPDLSSQIVKDWQQGNLNPKHKSLDVNYITTGSVLVWVKVDVILCLDIKQFYSALDKLVKDIFKKYTAHVPLYCVHVYDMATGNRTIRCNTTKSQYENSSKKNIPLNFRDEGYVDHLKDEFYCGDCKLKFTTLDDFISHQNTSCFQPFGTEVVTPVIDGDDQEELSNRLRAVGLVEYGDKAELDSDYEEEMYMNEDHKRDFFKPKKIKLRDYQLELAENALTGKSTVICADTGSGKTWVALHIIQEHINSKESPKVGFMARTNLLVQQQYKLFKYFLGEKRVYILNKDDKSTVPLKKLMEFYDVFFFTPQILINNIENGETRIPQFTLLILDECHHTAKRGPYNNLMRRYLKFKLRNEDIPLPQIVGLTASMGVGSATAEDGVIGHMIKIFSNLDVHEISTVEKNKEEMKKYVTIPTEEHVKMKVCYDDPCKPIIEGEMRKVELIYEGIMKGKGVMNTRQNLPGGDYLSKTYLGSIVKLKNQIMCDTTLPEDSVREMICCLTHLGVLHEALDINYLMNVGHVVQFLNTKYVEENQQEDRMIPLERKLIIFRKDLIKTFENQKYQKDVRPNPNLCLIEEKIQDLYSESGKDSLGMICVQTRATAKSLAEYLNDKLQGIEIPVKPFIGSKSSETSDGLSETEKKELLEDFRSHKIKLLVATSYGSEGMDVPECNIVMKCNYSGNEINIIQMQGRTRRAVGQAMFISNQSVLRRDLVSMEKAVTMHRALDELKQIGKDQIKALILTEQRNALKQQEDQERKLRDLQKQKKRCSFKLVCATCKQTEINGDNIKVYKQTHHVAAERKFLDRIERKDVKEERINQMIKKSLIYCKHCPQKFGTIFLIHDLEVPLVRIDAFLCKEGDKLRKYKNWKFVPYIIDEINHNDLEIIFPKLTIPEVT